MRSSRSLRPAQGRPGDSAAFRVSHSEWLWAVTVSVAALLLSSLPVLAGYVAQPPGLIFGGTVFNRMDYEVHLGTIQVGWRGQWTYTLLDSATPASPIFIKTFYILLGQIGRLLPLPAAGLFQAARIVCGFWALLTMYAFAARFLWPIPLRRTAFFLCAFSSGLGWLLFALHWQPSPGVSPIDFWLADLYGFFSLIQFPHFLAVMALLWTAALAMLEFWRGGRARWMLLCAVALVLAQMFQPFMPLVVDCSLGGYAAIGWLRRRRIAWRECGSLTGLAASQTPLFVYTFLAVNGDPAWRSFSQQNVTRSPAPIYYVLGLGLLGLLALWGGWCVVRRRWGEAHLLVAWLVVVAVLAYLPLQFQRRFTEGLMGPMAVLASIGLARGVLPVSRRLGRLRQWMAHVGYPYRRARGLLWLLIVAFTMPSSLYLATGGALLAVSRSPALYDRSDVVAAVGWLGAHSDWQATVLSAERTGSLLVARTGHRVVLGHPIETVDYAQRTQEIKAFYGPDLSDCQRQQMLSALGVRYVFFGPSERVAGGFDPAAVGFLAERFSTGDVAVYEVVQP